ncbi:MAG TPA: NAD(+)/NADH kinase, partial [Steroidobacteraceae bacterium]|nr:NAD(+)/NADH kinase [Steroidobacteraceae bacterium]
MHKPIRTCALVGQFQDPRVAECAQALIPVLQARQLTVLAPEAGPAGPTPEGALSAALPELIARAELVIAIGGDGTLLHAAGLVGGSGIPLLGINRGRLGFLTDVLPQDMVTCIDAVLAGDCTAEQRRLLHARLTAPGGGV